MADHNDVEAPRWRRLAAWWAVTLLIQATYLFLTFVTLVDWALTFAWRPVSPVMTVILILVTLSVFARTRFPRVFFAAPLTFALAFAYGFEPRVPTLTGLLFLIIVSGSVAFSTVSFPIAAAAAISISTAFTLGLVVVRGVSPFHLIPLFMTAGMAIALFSGQLSSARRRLIDAARRRALEAEETREAVAATRVAEQRLATARDLHDVVGHRIAAINLHAGLANATLETEPQQARASLSVVEESAGRILDEIGALLRALRRDDAGALPTPMTARELPRLVNTLSAGGLPIELSVDDALPQLDPEVDEALYRILEETLVNAYKHGAPGAQASARIGWDGRAITVDVTNTIEDAGSPSRSTGLGLVGISERARALGGTLTVTREMGHFMVGVNIPVGTA
ncbi:sensor histidine kinase [Microbacterium enclense]|uniref:histidine kinase n=1 Tax=Microbacterium enclense TaxID=993073 RepID=A0A1G6GMJ8_9MICO|nr:histidine kinase [Microbacterium enclense]KSU56367.1 hypothetical protein AS029_01015 [Microbacterium enclense]SDB83250.1 Signal transduction histidine kinase [Microbacterium enclense]